MRLLRFSLAAVLAALVGAVAVANPASAHISVSPEEAVQGGLARLTFRVPTESDTASTTKVEVFLPEDAPVANVSTMPVAGWTVAVQRKSPEAVSVITWTASKSAAIKPGEFQEFPISLGPLPNVDEMVFKALQTYSDGNVVRWIEPPEPGAEPEHPAPVLKLVPAGAAAPTTPTGNDDDEDGPGAALWLGIAGLVAGLGGLVLGGLAFARTRRTAN